MPKSIRSLLAVVLAAACVFAVIRWNWGLALFLLAITPLSYGIYRLRKPGIQLRSRLMTLSMLAVGVLIAYVFSPGPFVGAGQLLFALTGSVGPWNDIFGYIYRPHFEFCTGAYGTETFNNLFNDYIIQWQLLCRPR